MSGRQYLKSIRKAGSSKDEPCVLHRADEPEVKPPGFIESLPLVTSENSGSGLSPLKPEEKKGKETAPSQIAAVPTTQKPEEKKAEEPTLEQSAPVPQTQQTEGKKTISDPQPAAGQAHQPESRSSKEPDPNQPITSPPGQKPEEKKELAPAPQQPSATKPQPLTEPRDTSIKEPQKPVHAESIRPAGQEPTASKGGLKEPVPLSQETQVPKTQEKSLVTHGIKEPLPEGRPQEGCELSWPVGKHDTWEEKAAAESISEKKHDLPRKEALVSKTPQQEPSAPNGLGMYAATLGAVSVLVLGAIWLLKLARK